MFVLQQLRVLNSIFLEDLFHPNSSHDPLHNRLTTYRGCHIDPKIIIANKEIWVLPTLLDCSPAVKVWSNYWPLVRPHLGEWYQLLELQIIATDEIRITFHRILTRVFNNEWVISALDLSSSTHIRPPRLEIRQRREKAGRRHSLQSLWEGDTA